MSGVPRGQKRKHEGTNTARKRRRRVASVGKGRVDVQAAFYQVFGHTLQIHSAWKATQGADHLLEAMAVLRYIAKTRLEVGAEEGTNAANVNERGGAAILKKVQLPAKRQRLAVPVPWVLVFRQPAPVPRAEREEDVGPAEFVEPEEAVEPEEGAELERAWCPTIDERC
ncbi:hypothetical protein F442_10900 [Phytophthora nicotianae P10297]|uniref:Uncharacterized protein n=1 Tax=Phytophthora nicotianae P10297 TaxID=1317064 RepID=W2Z4G6_PHYNI|nr:hypothetical protein F442_10900 [Phytophthora nicotianae P10297]